MLKYVFQNIRKRKIRTVLTVFAIMVCIQMFTVIYSIVEYTVADLEGEMAKYAGQMYVKNISASSSAGEDFPPINSTISSKTGDDILKSVDTKVNTDLSTPIIFRPIAGATAPNMPPQALAVGVSSGKETAYTGENVDLKKGSMELAEGEKQVVLGAGAAQFFQVNNIGEKIDISGETFEVIGLLKKGNRVTDPMVLAPIDQLQKVFALETTYSTLLLTAKSIEQIDTLSKTIETDFKDVEVMTQGNIADNINQSLAGTKMFMNTILGTVIAVAVIVILIVMTLAIMERTKEIGVMRAIGAQKWDITKIIILESLCMSLIGGVLGVIGGYLIMRFIFTAPEFITVKIAVTSIVMAVLVGILSSLYPGIKAVSIQPQEALRYE
ncbi:putative ABC transport system permease protein [Bacillus thermophilus]|uniref:ABC transport system permease protein n=1 Tax=Siminovitchia thermophila TaxID=1245522 RepID=A0ABS2RAE6_9BACI|nr:ABC transporter permease [Siminovitchia thermophila]MBM7716602.1 putative ABC transport system permease protein [Siminovitchia thermophila]